MLVLHQRDGIDAAANNDIHAVMEHLLGRSRDSHHARGALTIDCHARYGDRKASAKCRGAADVAALTALSQRGSHDAILNAISFNACALDGSADSVPGQGRRSQIIEASAVSLTNRGACG